MNQKRTRSTGLLTAAELELMKILWTLGEGSVNDVLAGLPRGLAYTSVSTILRILEQKGMVGSRKEGRGHVYIPKISKQRYENRSVGKLVQEVFDGAPAALVKSLLDSTNLDESELKKIRELLERKP